MGKVYEHSTALVNAHFEVSTEHGKEYLLDIIEGYEKELNKKTVVNQFSDFVGRIDWPNFAMFLVIVGIVAVAVWGISFAVAEDNQAKIDFHNCVDKNDKDACTNYMIHTGDDTAKYLVSKHLDAIKEGKK